MGTWDSWHQDSRCKNGLDPDLDGHWEALLSTSMPAEILQPGLLFVWRAGPRLHYCDERGWILCSVSNSVTKSSIAFLQVRCKLFAGGCHVNHVLHMQCPRLLARPGHDRPTKNYCNLQIQNNKREGYEHEACLFRSLWTGRAWLLRVQLQTDKNKYKGPVDHCTCGGPLYVWRLAMDSWFVTIPFWNSVFSPSPITLQQEAE